MAFQDPSLLLALLAAIFGGGVHDLASCISTDAYWNSKGVVVSYEQLSHELDPIKPADVSKFIQDLDADDPKTRDEAAARITATGTAAIPDLLEAAKNASPEIASRAKGLLARIRAGSKVVAVRRLMTIRTLGEMKNEHALPLLEPLLQSKEMFEADYAKAAIAKIQGKPYATPMATDAERAADLDMMPLDADMVVQVALTIDGEFPLDKVIDQMKDGDASRRKHAKAEVIDQVVKLLESMGNVRFDSMTEGSPFPGIMGPGGANPTAEVLVLARGQFDAAAVSSTLLKFIPKSRQVEGATVFEMEHQAAIIILSDRKIAIVGNAGGGDVNVEKAVAALKKPQGEFSKNASMAKLLKTIDRTKPLWMAMKIPQQMQQMMGGVGQIETLTLVVDETIEKDKTTTAHVTFEAVTANAAMAQQFVTMMQQTLPMGLQALKQQEATQPSMKPLVDFLGTIKFVAKDKIVTVTGAMKDVGGTVMPLIVNNMFEGK